MKISKKRLIITEIILASVLLIASATYSIYTSRADLNSTDVPIANFVFNGNKTENIELVFDELYPGSSLAYDFSVTNSSNEKVSEVTIEYQISIHTLHTIPLTYELVKVDGIEESIMVCNETSTRNAEGILECKAEIVQMNHDAEDIDNYKLKVSFPAVYNDVMYANLIDYVDIEIESWQKLD